MKNIYSLLLIACAQLTSSVLATEKPMLLYVEYDNLGHALINFNPAQNHYAWIDQWGNRKHTEYFMEPINTLLGKIPEETSYRDALSQDNAITTNASTNLDKLFNKLEEIRSRHTDLGWPTYFWRLVTTKQTKNLKTYSWQVPTATVTLSDKINPPVVLKNDTVFETDAQEVISLYTVFVTGLQNK